VGATVTWTASASDNVPIEYRFSVQSGTQAPQVVRDYESAASFTWTPLAEGSYTIQVTVQEVPPSTNQPVSLSAGYSIVSRITNNLAVITPTSNPLVALYSLPPCGKGGVALFFGSGPDSQTYVTTPLYQCSTTQSTNVYLAGMRSQSTYKIVPIYVTGKGKTYGRPSVFTTGVLSSTITMPSLTVPVPAMPGADTAQGVVFHDGNGFPWTNNPTPPLRTYATDLSGNLIWYNALQNTFLVRALPGGNIIAIVGGPSTGSNQKLDIFDPAGNTVQETSVGRINEQLAALPSTPGHTIQQISVLHHEANLLPNGHTVAIGYVEQLFPPGTQGVTGTLPVDVLGDEIIDLDQNFQVDWTWNSFDYLSVNRPDSLAETCPMPYQGCPPLLLGSQSGGVAQDWTHSSSAIYSPSDHDLLVSVRNQDWVIKLDYQDAAGTGNVLWRLGTGGDFAINDPSNNPWPWFSHGHGVDFDSAGNLVIFDNGMVRCNNAPTGTCDSRGQVYHLDTVGMVATLSLNADLHLYSAQQGWAQSLSNGDYSWTAGEIAGTDGSGNTLRMGQDVETTRDGTTINFVMQEVQQVNRIYRMANLYQGCCTP
jgi:hypothetical protein